MPYTHEFKKIAERYACWEMRLCDDSSGGQIEKLRAVMPEMMPDNEVLIYQWIPPRRDPVSNQPMEVCRLRLYRVPVGKDGPNINALAKVMNEFDSIPTAVKMPEKQDILPELANMREEDLDTIGPTVGLSFPRGADIKIKRILLSRECNTSARGKQVIQRIREAVSKTVNPPVLTGVA